MGTKKLTRAVVAVALFAAACFVCANELEVLSVRENGPGAIVARVSFTGGEVPQKSSLRLIFDDQHAFPAVDVKPVAATPLSAQIVVLVDHSGSMGQNAIKDVKDSLKSVAAIPGPQRKLALIAFGTRTYMLSGLSEDASQFVQAVDGLKRESAPDGRTHLYDAVSEALMSLNASRAEGPKSMVVISDGKDEGSQLGLDDIVRQAKTLAIPVNAIGFGTLTETSSDSLKSLAEQTGGKFVQAYAGVLSVELGRFLSPARSGPTFDVAFKYQPLPGGQLVTNAVLEFSQNGQDTVKQAIGKAVAAPQAAPTNAPPAAGGNEEKTSKWDITLFKINIDSKVVLGLLAGGTTLFVAGRIIYLHRRKVIVSSNSISDPMLPPPQLPKKRRGTAVSAVFPTPQKGHPAAILVCQSGPAKGKRYPIEQTLLRIGADAGNDLCLTGDDFVSNEHATIKFEMGSLYLSDRNSRNGTFQNGTRLSHTAATLSPSDQIKIGRTMFVLRMAQNGAEGGPDWTEPSVP